MITVLAMFYLQSWEIGVVESVAVVTMIGFSIDYVVHLSKSYTQCVKYKRQERIRDAYYEMGGSIVSGFITTFGSGFFLFFTQLLIFYKFAWVITCTATASLFYSLILYGALCHQFGAQGS
jgi:predicted RND superfamily exporter protein